MIKLSDAKLIIECKCPYCCKDIRAEVFNLWTATIDINYDEVEVYEVEMSAKCPECQATFDIDFLT